MVTSRTLKWQLQKSIGVYKATSRFTRRYRSLNKVKSKVVTWVNSIKSLFSLPIRHGGLGIKDPVDHASRAFPASEKIVSALNGFSIFSVKSHLSHLNDAYSASSQNQQTHDSEVLRDILGLLSPGQRRAVAGADPGFCKGGVIIKI